VVSRLGPYFGLKIDNLESSTIRKITSSIGKDFRILTFISLSRSSILYRGGEQGVNDFGMDFGSGKVNNQLRASSIASNLCGMLVMFASVMIH